MSAKPATAQESASQCHSPCQDCVCSHEPGVAKSNDTIANVENRMLRLFKLNVYGSNIRVLVVQMELRSPGRQRGNKNLASLGHIYSRERQAFRTFQHRQHVGGSSPHWVSCVGSTGVEILPSATRTGEDRSCSLLGSAQQHGRVA